ncbi:MAG: hypothetical protein M3437_00965 [Chloroflexota bacterium]|nr:hypothetical protein [Chloroflexota bacterium]MDQ5866332.1 hypothetical protein [Chloroflexota bacterium]
MSGNIERGTNTSEQDVGVVNDSDMIEPSRTGNELSTPARASLDGLEVDAQNPNIVRAVPSAQSATDEMAGSTSPSTRDDEYGDIIEGSDSERTGTSWGLPGREDNEVEVGASAVQEGEGEDEAHPNRNTGERLTRDELDNVGSWSTIDKDKADSAGSPSGFS